MKLKLKNGGTIKLQNGAIFPENTPSQLMDNVGLHVTRVWVPEPLPQKSLWDRISEWFQKRKEALKSTTREKYIGPLVLTTDGTKRVKRGGYLP